MTSFIGFGEWDDEDDEPVRHHASGGGSGSLARVASLRSLARVASLGSLAYTQAAATGSLPRVYSVPHRMGTQVDAPPQKASTAVLLPQSTLALLLPSAQSVPSLPDLRPHPLCLG